MPLTTQSLAQVKVVQREVDAFYVRQRINVGKLMEVNGRITPTLKIRLRRSKYLLGYGDGYVRWATGTNAVYLQRLRHPTYRLSLAVVRRGIERRAAARLLRTSARGVLRIANYEGFFPGPYNDPVGHCTAYYGHLIHRGNCTAADFRRWPRLSRTAALRYLVLDLRPYESAVRVGLIRPSQCEFDASVSLGFNIGSSGFLMSSVRRFHNLGQKIRAANAFLLWVFADGQRLLGLERRRTSERAEYLRC
jgi:lysozyme